MKKWYCLAQQLHQRERIQIHRILKYGKELRDSIFGTECVTCGRTRKFIHKKDGKSHPSEILWRRKYLLELNPNDWAALCSPCHRLVHSLMKNFGCEWVEIETTLKKLAKE